jgi:hypothetical protein
MKLKFTSNPITQTVAICAALLAGSLTGLAQSSYTITNAVASAFMASGSPSNPQGTNLTSVNFGGAGTLAIAPASSLKGEFDSILEINTATAVSQFNSLYGAGNWIITGLTLSLASNFGGQGEQPTSHLFNTVNAGSFGIDWLANNSWVQGNGGGSGTPGYPNPNNYVTLQSVPGLLAGGYDSLGTYTYTPPGDNKYDSYSLQMDPNLVAGAAAGTNVSLYFYAADNQVSYLFNAGTFASNHPELTLTAAPIPEPAMPALLLLGAGVFASRRRH